MARKSKRYLDQEAETSAPLVTKYFVGIYSRLSVDNDEKKSESVDNQIAVVNQFINQNNANPDRKMELVVYDTYIDKGKTGTNFERENFKRLMDDVKKHHVTCIIVKDFSRFGRDYIETGNYIEKILPFLGVRFISVTDGFDSMSETADSGKLAMNIKNLVNDMYAKDISKRISISKRFNQERGSFVGSIAPYGYRVVVACGIRKLAIDEKASVIVRWIYEEYIQGKTLDEIRASLYDQRIHRISDYWMNGHVHCQESEILHQWNKDIIKNLINNPAYVGDLVQGKHSSKLYQGKKGRELTLPDEWVVVRDVHEPIICRDIFEKALSRIDFETTMKTASVIRKNHELLAEKEHIFENVLFCADCGRKLKGVYYQSRLNGERHYTYYCPAAYYIDERQCYKRYITESKLVKLLHEIIREEFGALGLRAKDVTRMNNEIAKQHMEQYDKEEQQLLKHGELLKHKAAEMFLQYKESNISRDTYELFRKNKDELEKTYTLCLQQLERKKNQSIRKAEEENKFLRSLFKMDSKKALNARLIESMVENIQMHATGKVSIKFKFKRGDYANE
jgi:hypothetical protein